MRRASLVLIALLAFCLPAWAQAEGPKTTTDLETDAVGESVPLVFFNRTVFVFRATVEGYTPEQRAKVALERLKAGVVAPGPGKVTVRVAAGGHIIEVDGMPVFAVRPGDVNALRGESLESLSASTRERVEEAVSAYHAVYDPGAWGIALLRFGVATAVWVLLLWGVVLLRRWAAGRVSTALARRVGEVRLAGVTFGNIDKLSHGVQRFVASLALLLGLVLSYFWLTFSLAQFSYTEPWAGQMRGYFLDVLRRVVLAVVRAIPELVFVVVIFLITRALVQMVRLFFLRVEHGRIKLSWVDEETAGPTRRLITIGLWLFAVAFAYPYLPGADTDAFKGVSVLVGLMISLGGASVVGQVLSGLTLMYQRPLKAGDYVRVADVDGTVVTVGYMRTTIHTGTGEMVSIPNSTIVASAVRNLSRLVEGKGFVLHTALTIGYDTPWRQVHAMLLEAAGRTAGVAREPAPYVVQTALSDFYVEYRLVCQASLNEAGRRAEAMSALHANIQDVFNEHGVQIMSPHYLGDPQTAKIVPQAQWYAPPAQPPDDRRGG
jgi:small-conductance mechanosensitive channel